MSIAVLYSRGRTGIDAPLVTVEVHISRGMPRFSIVGLPEKAVKESKDRVRSAILTNAFEFPHHITVNLGPADLPKEGGRFDLPIALGILAATEQIPKDVLGAYEFVGELSLTGILQKVSGILPFAIATKKAQRKLILPAENLQEAALSAAYLYPAKNLLDVCAHLTNTKLLNLHQESIRDNFSIFPDISEVKGQDQAKRALEIAASGRHNLLLYGQPGSGKTMLASRLISLLPELHLEEALQVAAIYSISQTQFDLKKWRLHPFRAPHHTASSVALVGGSSPPRPGEISLAHHGVLFMDELPEFRRDVLEALREPLESGQISISRATYQTVFPAKFQLIAAMNPCPCGFYGDPQSVCRCTSEQIQKYQRKISGPFLDRIDLYISVTKVNKDILLMKENTAESSATIKMRVVKARQLQMQRAQKLNADLTPRDIEQFCKLDLESQNFLEKNIDKLKISARSLHRILKVSRTIADLNSANEIEFSHLAEALSFRRVWK